MNQDSSSFILLPSSFRRAGGGIRTHIDRITGAAPFYVEPHRRVHGSPHTPCADVSARVACRLPSAGAQGFEPCATVLEAVCSPRSTPLLIRCLAGIEPSTARVTTSNAPITPQTQ